MEMRPSIIVEMVSPAVMISACGLLMSVLGNRYSRIIDRIRVFSAELRSLKKTHPQLVPLDLERIHALELQLPELHRRGRLIRNGLLLLQLGVFWFVVCSFSIPFHFTPLTATLFCLGMASVLAGDYFALRETWISFRQIQYDLPGTIAGESDSTPSGFH